MLLWGLPAVLAAALLALTVGRPLFHGATSFGFRNANKVRHLAFEDGAQRVALNRRGGRWLIGGSGEAAQQDKLADALYALQMLQVKYPLTDAQRQRYASTLAGGGLRVEVGGWLGTLRSYSLYRGDSLPVGWVGAGDPYYVLEVRGNEGLSLFSLLGANAMDWRRTLIVNLPPAQIASVAVEDLANPARSFTLTLDTLGGATLLAMYSGEQHGHGDLNMERVRRYLSYFRGLSLERYATELGKEEAEAVLLGDAACIITIVSREGVPQVIKLFNIPVGDELDAFGRPTKVDLNRCYLQVDDDPNLAVALWVDFDLLIKEVKFFVNTP
jgi:hypothetical protein